MPDPISCFLVVEDQRNQDFHVWPKDEVLIFPSHMTCSDLIMEMNIFLLVELMLFHNSCNSVLGIPTLLNSRLICKVDCSLIRIRIFHNGN